MFYELSTCQLYFCMQIFILFFLFIFSVRLFVRSFSPVLAKNATLFERKKKMNESFGLVHTVLEYLFLFLCVYEVDGIELIMRKYYIFELISTFLGVVRTRLLRG